jgi:hypothetical protein
MKPSQVSARLRVIAEKIDRSKQPSRKLVALAVRRILATVTNNLAGLKLVKANIVEYDPRSLQDTGFLTVAGDFEFVSPSGKKIEVTGRSAADGLNIKVKVDGKEIPYPEGEEDWPLWAIDPEGYPEGSNDAYTSIHHVMEDVAESMAQKK